MLDFCLFQRLCTRSDFRAVTELEQLRAENRVLREALEDATEGLVCALSDPCHSEEYQCVPTTVEVASAQGYLNTAKSALAASPETAREVERVKVLEFVAQEGRPLSIPSREYYGEHFQNLREAYAELDKIDKERP